MALESIKKLIPTSLKHAGWKPQIDAMMILEMASKILEGLWGSEKAKHIKFISIKNGCLKAGSLSGVATQELKLMEVRLKNEINRALGAKKVTILKVGRF